MTKFAREVGFLEELRDELDAHFTDEIAAGLFGAAASAFFAGPQGVAAMFERYARFQSKDS